jgi:predicted nucleotidyltransferase
MLQALRRCVAVALGDRRGAVECHIFGSFASGLSLHSSDLDVALIGVCVWGGGSRRGVQEGGRLALSDALYASQVYV